MSDTTDAPITHPEEMRFSGEVPLNDKLMFRATCG